MPRKIRFADEESDVVVVKTKPLSQPSSSTAASDSNNNSKAVVDDKNEKGSSSSSSSRDRTTRSSKNSSNGRGGKYSRDSSSDGGSSNGEEEEADVLYSEKTSSSSSSTTPTTTTTTTAAAGKPTSDPPSLASSSAKAGKSREGEKETKTNDQSDGKAKSNEKDNNNNTSTKQQTYLSGPLGASKIAVLRAGGGGAGAALALPPVPAAHPMGSGGGGLTRRPSSGEMIASNGQIRVAGAGPAASSLPGTMNSVLGDAMRRNAQYTVQSVKDEVLVSSIVDSEDLTPALQAVFREHMEKNVVTHLDTFFAAKQREILTICNRGFADFISSIGELLSVREDLVAVRDDCVSVNEKIQSHGATMTQKTQQLLLMKRRRQHIDTAQLVLQQCCYVLSLCVDARQQTAKGNYYSALKILAKLRQLELRRTATVQFGIYIESQIPILATLIKESVLSHFTTFLVHVRNKATDVGRFAMQRLHRRQKYEDEYRHDGGNRRGGEGEEGGDEDKGGLGEEEEYDLAKIDFAPLYQCLYIHDRLGQRDEFRAFYKQIRRQQAGLDLRAPMSLISSYSEFLYRFAGFFIIEDAVHSCCRATLLSRTDIDSLWEESSSLLVQDLLELFQRTDQSMLLQQIRTMVILFCLTLEDVGYLVKTITECLEATHDRFLALLMREGEEMVNKITLEEDFQPMMIPKESDYERLIRAHELDVYDPHTTDSFPRTLRFSRTVPRLCQAVKSFGFDYFNFVRDSSDAVVQVRRGVDMFVEKCLAPSVDRILTKRDITPQQAVQMSVNSHVLAEHTAFFDRYATSLAPDFEAGGEGNQLQLRAAGKLLEIRSRADDVLLRIVLHKLDDLLATAPKDMAPPAPPSEPSTWVEETIVFLRGTFAAMASLPAAIQDAMNHAACHHIASTLMHTLVQPNVRRINDAGLQTMELDLQSLAEFVETLPTADLRRCFRRNEQLLDLVLHTESVDIMLNPKTRATRFDALDPMQLIPILDKYAADKSSVFGRPATEDGARKKRAIEALIKGLRDG